MNRIYKVSCQKSWGEHVGVYIENWGMVFHNAPGKGEHLSSLEDFGPRNKISSEEITSISSIIVMERINRALRNPGKYSLTQFNCDHAFNKVVYGQIVSPQLQNVGKGLAVFAVCILLLSAFSKS